MSKEIKAVEKPSQHTVLVADDSRFFRSMLAYALDEDGHGCLAAASGDELLALAARELPGIDAFIIDMVMPGLNGIQLIEQLRRIEGAAAIPIIVITQFGLNGLERAILGEHGVATILPKTVSVERILWELREVLHPEARDLRARPRSPTSLPVTVRAPGKIWISATFNLSEGGMFLALPDGQAPREGSEVRIKFWIPDAPELIELDAKVVCINPAGPGVQRSHPPGFGVVFVTPPAAAVAAIRSYIEISRNGFTG